MLSSIFKSKRESSFEWIQLQSIEQIEEINDESSKNAVVIFKHSTRCSISSMSLSRFEREFENQYDIKLYYLDIIRFREISNRIAELFQLNHESPQLLLIKDSKVVYHASHIAIRASELNRQLN